MAEWNPIPINPNNSSLRPYKLSLPAQPLLIFLSFSTLDHVSAAFSNPATERWAPLGKVYISRLMFYPRRRVVERYLPKNLRTLNAILEILSPSATLCFCNPRVRIQRTIFFTFFCYGLHIAFSDRRYQVYLTTLDGQPLSEKLF